MNRVYIYYRRLNDITARLELQYTQLSEDYYVTANDLYSVNIILKAWKRCASFTQKSVAYYLATQSVDNTIEALIISARKWPKGGFK